MLLKVKKLRTLLFVASVFLIYPSYGQNFQLNSKLNSAQLRSLFQIVEELLPPILKNKIAVEINVVFEDLGDAYGKTRKTHLLQFTKNIHTISLSSKFLPLFDSKYGKASKGFDLAKIKETLIHELAHLYDYRFIPDAEHSNQVLRCRQLEQIQNSGKPSSQPTASANSYCQTILARSRVVSGDPFFQKLSDWENSGRSKNTRPNRLIRYSLLNAEEFFAVHFSLFILDSNFSCRMPALNAYFSKHFAHVPKFSSRCHTSTRVAFENSNSFGDIDFRRLYEVHVITADSGENIASKFGHSLLRLVFCSPKRQKLGKECLADVQDHVVLGFRGNILELQQSVMKGITGVYESQILFFPWPKVEIDYTKNQLRALQSIPLILSTEQKKNLVLRALEMHWTYGGDYKFFSNNCATEILDLLVAVTKNSRLAESSAISPNGVVKALRDAKILDESRKILIPSYQNKLKEAFVMMRQIAMPFYQNLPPNFKDELLYIESTDAEYRASLFHSILKGTDKSFMRKQLSAFYVLESYILNKNKERFGKVKAGALIGAIEGKLKPRSSGGVVEQEDHEMFEELKNHAQKVERLIALRNSLAPAARVLKGYGVPQDMDFLDGKPELENERLQILSEDIGRALKERDEFFQRYYSKTYAELNRIQDNMLSFLKKIMELGI